jgi:signal transduction histidine kinase
MNRLGKLFLFTVLFFINNKLAAKNYLDSVKSEVSRCSTNSIRYELFCAIGSAYAYTGVISYIDSANRYFDSATAYAEQMRSASCQLRVKLLRTFMMPRNSVADRGKKRNRLIALIAESKKQQSLENEAYGTLQLGYLYITEDSLHAQNLINASTDIYRRLHDSTGIAVSQAILAQFFFRRGYVDDAYKYAKLSEYYFRRNIQNSYFLHYKMYNLQQLAAITSSKNEYTLSEKYSWQVLDVALKTDSITYVDIVYTDLSDIFKRDKQYDSALAIMKNVLGYINRTKSREILPRYYFSMADIYKCKGDKYQSKINIDSSFSNIKYINSAYEKCIAQLELTDYYYDNKEVKMAISVALLALRNAEADGHLVLSLNCYKRLYMCFELMGDYKNAFIYFEKYNKVQSEYLMTKSNQQIVKLQLEKDFKDKERQYLIEKYELKQKLLGKSKKNDLVIFACIASILLLVVVVLVLANQKLNERHAFRKNMADQHRDYALAVVAAHEDERKKIAEDIHDGLGAYLSSLKINLSVVRRDVADQSKYLVDNMETAVCKIGEEIKSIADFLVSDTLQKYGLIFAIEELVEIVNAAHVVKIVFEISGELDTVPYYTQNCIFRVVQELINNLVKHSGALNCNLNIKLDENILIHYLDDGVGIQLDSKADKKGKGLKNIQNRINILGGDFEIEPLSIPSTSILIKIPNKI